MTSDNQTLLTAIREMIAEANAPVMALLQQLDSRVETLDARTSQLLSDVRDLRERVTLFEERLDNGFRALKSDLNFAFSDIRKISIAQERSDRMIEEFKREKEKEIEGLKRELAGLQQRLEILEGRQSTS
jgi:predicted  nucleic acid-binding Zn-ribbon protein